MPEASVGWPLVVGSTPTETRVPGQPPISDPVELIHPAVRPAAGEVVVGKHRVNALHGTALDLILRANARDTLIMLGYATSGVVLSTVRAAADLDYRLVVVEDCCADQDADVHAFLTVVEPDWEPELNEEHDEYRWLPRDEAVKLLFWPEPAAVLRSLP